MDDVHGRAGHFRERNGARRCLCFGGGGPRQGVILRRALSLGQCALHDDVNRAAVFRVHADQSAMLGGLRHSAKNRGVVEHKDARIGHEQLEAAHSFADELSHLFELRRAKVGDDAMKGVVGDGFALGLFHPGLERLTETLSLVLNGEVNQRCCPAECGRDRAALEIVRAGGPAKGHVEMRVYVNPAGHDVTTCCVNDSPGIFGRKLCPNRRHFVAGNAHFPGVHVRCCDDDSVSNQRVKTHAEPSGLLP